MLPYNQKANIFMQIMHKNNSKYCKIHFFMHRRILTAASINNDRNIHLSSELIIQFLCVKEKLNEIQNSPPLWNEVD